MKNYNKLFAGLIKELKENNYIDIQEIDTDFSALQGTNLDFFDHKLKKNLNFSLPKEKQDVFNFFNYTRVYWFYKINEELKGTGDFNLENAYRSISKSKPHKIWNDSTPEKDIEILKQFRVLIDSPDAGDNKLIGFRLTPGTYSEELWFYNRGQLYPMKLDYEGLLNALLETKGIGNWEYFFCDFDPKDSLHKNILDMLRKDLSALKILFPDVDYTYYDKKISSLNEIG
ncbi:hypothetical protein AWE51_19130 [Aquimarina aggregata]|uniref:Uncharacterized protein n=1 Tax=Aquimarina aggregata TaxID=1642818 RepID=A0A162WKI9_9FLAO|nr:hypothetical protein [Aquimarina aggregata]KZS38159.1 hypothetical protein AWE51_19130 [Aquimarina aggregata]